MPEANMIEDAKLRELFKAESEEHLQRLDDALLQLEKTPADQALLEEAFREAHSLKGAARMLGLNGIQKPAHELEDELNSARRGTQALDAEVLARISARVAAIRRLALEAVTAGDMSAQSAVPEQPPAPHSPSSASAASAAPSAAAPPRTEPEAAAAAPISSAPFRIESVRVDTRKLDTS